MKIYLIILILIINLIFIYLLIYNEIINALIKENKLNNDNIIIDKYISKRNLIPISNKYKIIKNKYDFSDYHLIIYWNSNYNCNIILRRLDDIYISEDLIIYIYNIENTKYTEIYIKNKYINEININVNVSIKLYQTDLNQKQLIPKIIIQTTKSNKITKACYNAIYTFIDLNPEYEYILFDDNDCIDFIKNNFNDDVINAYNSLIPTAYKADLFRYCVLYIYGGCYFDIKQIDRIPLRKLIDSHEEIILTEDNNKDAYYNAIMLVKKHHPLMIELINQVIKNVNNKYYGTCSLCPTGPCLLYKLGKHIKPKFYYKPSFYELKFTELRSRAKITYNKLDIINITYHGYYKKIDMSRYSNLWFQNNIYKN